MKLNPTAKKYLLNALKIVATVLPFLLIFGSSKMEVILSLTKSIPWQNITAIIFLTIFTIAIQGFRWWYLLRVFISDISIFRVLEVHFKATFYSIAVPSSIAQDVIRAALFSRESDYKIAWGASWVARVIGMTAYIPVALTGWLLIDKTGMPQWINFALIGVFVAIIVAISFSFSKRFTRPIRGITQKFIPAHISSILEKVREGIYMYRGKFIPMAIASLITLALLGLCLLNTILIVKTICGHAYWRECFFFIPAIETAVVSLPITPNGMGIREGLSYFFLKIYLHFTPEQISLYVLFSIMIVSLKLVGCFAFLPGFIRNRKK